LASAQDPGRGGQIDFEFKITLQNGSIRWLNIKGNTEFLGSGENCRPLRGFGAVVDITGRKTAEDALRAERMLLSVTLDTAPIGIALINAEGGIVRLNDAVRKMWGGLAPLAEGMVEYRTYQGWWPDTHEPL
jgi:PAS domain-containing protein